MTGEVECRYYGRRFTAEEMALLRALIAAEPPPTRNALSREFCRRIGWLKPDGGLKDMMARVTMLAMHRDGLIALPPPTQRRSRAGPMAFGQDTEPPLFPAPTTVDEVRPLDLRPVLRGTREGKLWNEFVARYHYLGYKTLVGAQMRYAVHDRNGWPVAMLGFSTAAWRLAPRDKFIGWTPELREKNLPLVVDNPRFLILPWIDIPNLGSHILAIVRRRLPEHWTERYNITPQGKLVHSLGLSWLDRGAAFPRMIGSPVGIFADGGMSGPRWESCYGLTITCRHIGALRLRSGAGPSAWRFALPVEGGRALRVSGWVVAVYWRSF